MAKVRVTQGFLEVLVDEDGNLRVTQAALEASGVMPGNLRVTQAALEVAGLGVSTLRTTQAALEVTGFIAGPAVPYVTPSVITSTSATLTGDAFVQGTGSSGTHSESRWLCRRSSDGRVEYDSGPISDLLVHIVPTGSLPGYTNLIPSAMYKNADNQWSYYPGIGEVFQTLTDPVEAAVSLKFYDASWTLISEHVSPSTADTAYGDWLTSENIPVPTNTRYIVPCAYKVGSLLSDIRIKEFQVDRGRISAGYYPTAFRPTIHDETDVPFALTDEGAAGGSFDIDWELGNVATVELTTNATMSWSNLKAGGRYWLIVEQGAGGSHLLTWDAAAKHPAGVAPTLSTVAGSKDVFHIIAESASIAHVETVSLDSK